ncbi:galactoside 2-alpha-L-fucosyltransferase-like isoform X2 [Mercurialis annua]|uniref:galactoside 2-alpha-L-fucosyltransferase-like isoform X2 n=1 Tax=Mercurialis annua TaxID=3986 RepID=UPI00215DD975|nr:galactoside 2-alpha-L-fucosyltransferase-like isoform X2 [Mercurialis annua]
MLLNLVEDSPQPDRDVLLGGLLASGFDQESCLSRYQSVLYRKPSTKIPSSYLISKLRNYEKLHKKCEPYSESYNRTIKILGSKNISGPTECNYMVWTAQEGLGNRILSITSAFLYSLITNRVLLVEFYPDMMDLFCEPILNSTWLLPEDFPNEFRWSKNRPTFGNLMRSNVINATTEFPPSELFIYIASRLDFFDLLIYCEENHVLLLQKVPWLFLKSDEYFLPSFFLMSNFREDLDMMFPDKESVFHHLGRYLFHPSNKAWGLITRFYDSYLATAEELLAIQVRVFKPKSNPFDKLMDQILACTSQENLLPEIDKNKLIKSSNPSKNRTSKAILIASLYTKFSENITNMYWTFPTKKGELISVYQPSHEGSQHFGDNVHNMKAWVEMNLLSFSNVLVTSSGSTFGYVAQGFAGLRPWVLTRPENWNTSEPACRVGVSVEPCLHIPPSYDCKAEKNADMGEIVSYVKHCDDLPSGLKLVSN